eukprot:Gregarina_sp_Poly_1__917@NODE_1220_length_4741_cov_416_879974_g832_i0_p1_GENE_NODE_1220_length_4741_cov_416_879974_g832_i0NODE_1220_length_4741_cov_416_879974_g832_i0_p1_ORF_typecomplete_len632_score117_98RRM_1/PF00076_22/4_4e15RRM_1/PF00076_22/5_9e17RRM_1/PF00076_22/1_8e19RRM_5/PF13893_6/1_7e06RRM_5/PF13893_6/2_2e05RRM_5/PF13893_6/8e07RRM_7/PF16367_5/0_041RRM_7/PF16367_5/0_00065RRM_7/PF16367_5/2_1e06Nup35_RRM_2/PF14605_6/3_4e02Nup35_RRM_2/PF14605_6/0_0032Nup35_RRM_2/PF14605_6/0_003RRM_8/PF11835
MEGNNSAEPEVAHHQQTERLKDENQQTQSSQAPGATVESSMAQQSSEEPLQQHQGAAASSATSPASGAGLSQEATAGSANVAAGAGQHHQQQQSSSSQSAVLSGTATRSSPQGFQALPETPAVEIKLFVGRVPRNADENVIRPVFEEFGVVSEIAIIKDRNTGMHKGSAFVRMASITQADAAIRALNNVKILDPQLGALQVRYATGEAEKLGMTAESAYPGQDQAKLFVGSLPRTITEAEVRDIFATCGQIDEVFIMKDSASGQGKGCAFVKFAYKEQALHAIKLLSGMQQLSGAPRPLEVRFAESKKTIAAAAAGQPGGFGVSTAGMALATGAVTSGMNRPVNTMAAQSMLPAASAGAMAGQMYSQGGAAAATTPMMANHNPRTAGPWKEYFTDEGRPYYHNETTQQTQWERPAEFDRQDVAGPPGANIFVFHVPNDWTQQDLITNFSHFGPILSARIATDKTTGRNKGYAFVSYANIQSAAQAVQQMNGFMAGTKRLKVSIKQNEEMYVQHLLGGAMGTQAAAGGGVVMPQGSMLTSTGTTQSTAAMQANPLAYRGLAPNAYGGASMDAADPSQMGAATGAAATGQQLNAAGAYSAGGQAAAVQSRYAGPPTALHPATHRIPPAAYYLA